jgi:TolB-like protein/DNA-binding winged helix-turn-helix (wHTH) protein/Tfp pilus assembly protein PilF
MPAPDPARPLYRFSDFEFDPRTAELRRQGRKVRLREQPAQILTLLLQRPGELVTREEARQTLWPGDTFVDFDVGLNSAIKRLREALNDSAEEPRFVETLPRRGYRFIAPVEAPATAIEAIPVPEPPPPAMPAALAPRRRRARTAALASAAAVILGLAFVAARGRAPAPGADAVRIASIAVLPFENLSGDREQDYFVDGMTDQLITSLAQVHALRVISRTSVTQYKKTDKLLPRIAADLNVDAVVEGTVVRSGNRVRVTAQLIHAATDRHLWARSYERELRDVLALQAELAGAIAQAVQVKLRPDEQQRLAVARTATVNAVAYDAYLKGRYHLFSPEGQPREGLAKAAEYFQQAIAADPGYAPAYSGLSDTYRLSAVQRVRPSECMPKAEAAARKALALDETLAEAHASLAGVLYRYNWDWEGAEREFLRSLELDPNYAEGHRAYAVFLMTMRRHDEAIEEARRARDLSPLSAVINVELAGALVRARRYDEGMRQAQQALAIDPRSARAYTVVAMAHEGQGDRAKAVAALEAAATVAGRLGSAWLGYFYGTVGRRDEALAILAALEERSRNQYVSPQHFAVVHLGLGNDDQAFALLEKAYEDRAFELVGFSGPLFERLSGDPRFQDLLRRMRLPTAASRG